MSRRTLAVGGAILGTCFCLVLSGAAAAKLPPTPRDYVEIRDLSAVVLSPDSRHVAVRLESPSISTNQVAMDWYVVNVDGAAPPRKLASAGGWQDGGAGWASIERPQWSPDSQWLYYRMVKDAQVQVWRSSLAGQTEQVTRDEANIVRFALSADGASLRYVTKAARAAIVDAEEKEYRNGILYDRTIYSGYPLYHGWPIDGRMATMRVDGAKSTLLANTPEHLTTVDLLAPGLPKIQPKPQSGGARQIEDRNLSFADVGVKNLTHPDSEILTTLAGDGVAGLIPVGDKISGPLGDQVPYHWRLSWRPDAPGKPAVTCLDPECVGIASRFKGLVWSHVRHSVIVLADARNGEGRNSDSLLLEWDIAHNVVRKLFDASGMITAGDLMTGTMCPLLGNNAICILARPALPPRLVSISLASGAVKTLFAPNPELDSRSYSKVEHLLWSDPIGGPASGWLVYPSDYVPGRRYPLIITSYFCRGFLRGGFGERVPEQVMSHDGFLVLCTDYGSNFGVLAKGADGKPIAAYPYKQLTASWETITKELIKKGMVDGTRVALTGVSYGSLSAEYAISHSDMFAVAATGAVGDLDPAYYYFSGLPDGFQEVLRANLHHLPWPGDDPDGRWREVSPALNADRIDAPLLIQTSDNERFGMLQLVSNMRHLGKTVEVVMYPDETHRITQPRHRLAVLVRNIDWLRFWMQGYEDPDPAKRDQYDRWEKMRQAAPKRKIR